MGSEMTAAAFGAIGQVRRDPFAMLPFMGYHFGDYVKHWLEFGRKLPTAPLIFGVNWFRKDENGKFIWPGFGQNVRILKWIFDRVDGKAPAVEIPVGYVPKYEDLDWNGLDFSKEQFEKATSINIELWKQEIASHEDLFVKSYDKLPNEIRLMRELLLSTLWRAPKA